MGSNPFGIKGTKTDDIKQNLFYFMRETGLNPFDETYEVYDPKDKLIAKIVKKGSSNILFEAMIKEIKNHYKREAKSFKK